MFSCVVLCCGFVGLCDLVLCCVYCVVSRRVVSGCIVSNPPYNGGSVVFWFASSLLRQFLLSVYGYFVMFFLVILSSAHATSTFNTIGPPLFQDDFTSSVLLIPVQYIPFS